MRKPQIVFTDLLSGTQSETEPDDPAARAVITCLLWKDAKYDVKYWEENCEECGKLLAATEEEHSFHDGNPRFRPYMCPACSLRFNAWYNSLRRLSSSELREYFAEVRENARRWVN